MTPTQRFLYWIRERHNIYLKKEAGKPKPWTKDKILQSYFFTNPYRENDKTTVWFRENVRDPMRDHADVLMATIIFRWFNLINTGEILVKHNLLRQWNSKKAIRILGKIRDKKQPIFTGAFMINSPPGKPKLEAICERIDVINKDRHRLVLEMVPVKTLEAAHNLLTAYKGLGGFMAYEIVCDLRYTYFLENATDKMTWCNPGPGAIRGLYRIAGMKIPDPKGRGNTVQPKRLNDWQPRMAKLLKLARQNLKDLPPLEMREIEHSLCEFDKYERARRKDMGKMKRRYQGVEE